MTARQIMGWAASARRVAAPFATVLLVLLVVAAYALHRETRRLNNELETAMLAAEGKAERLAKQPQTEVVRRVAEIARSNSSELYVIYEGGRLVAGPRLDGGPFPPKEPHRPARYMAHAGDDRAPVYGAWIPFGAGRWMFYGERVTPYRQRTYALPLAILGGGAFSGLTLSAWAVWAERRVRRRLRGIEEDLGRFTKGELDARLSDAGEDDVSRVSRQVNRTLDRLQRVVTSLRLLGDQVAHEMKGGVARVRRRIQRVEASATDAERARWLAETAEECDAMLAAIDALLTLSTIDTRELLSLPPVALEAEVGRTVEMMRLLAEDAGLEVSVSLSPAQVRGDVGLLTQMTANLFENAVKYGAGGGCVAVSVAIESGRAILTVTDRGPGVPASSREEIFLPRRRLSRDAAMEGYGYGLALARSVALAHGGRIQVEDADPGARFVVELPLAVTAEPRPARSLAA